MSNQNDLNQAGNHFKLGCGLIAFAIFGVPFLLVGFLVAVGVFRAIFGG